MEFLPRRNNRSSNLLEGILHLIWWQRDGSFSFDEPMGILSKSRPVIYPDSTLKVDFTSICEFHNYLGQTLLQQRFYWQGWLQVYFQKSSTQWDEQWASFILGPFFITVLKVFILSLNLCIIIYVQNFFGDKRPLNGVQIVDILPSKSWQTAYNEHLLLGITTLKLPNVTLICQIRAQDKFPCVFKIGHAHGGLGKVSDNNIWI